MSAAEFLLPEVPEIQAARVGAWRWVDRAELDRLESPLNVRQFGYVALDATFA